MSYPCQQKSQESMAKQPATNTAVIVDSSWRTIRPPLLYSITLLLYFIMPQIRPLHVPPLLLASVFTIGGMMPFWNAPGAIRSFGLPEHIANSKLAQTCFTVYSSRMTAWGIGMWTFWFRNNLKAIDTMLSLLLYVGAVDGYVCWKEDVPNQGLFRAFSGVLVGGWGLLCLTSR
jgi:hypothetical protein